MSVRSESNSTPKNTRLKTAGSENRKANRRRVFSGTGSGIETYPSKQQHGPSYLGPSPSETVSNFYWRRHYSTPPSEHQRYRALGELSKSLGMHFRCSLSRSIRS